MLTLSYCECTVQNVNDRGSKVLELILWFLLTGGAFIEHEVQAEEEEPVPRRAGARAAGEERAPAQERARRAERVAEAPHREPLPEQGREGGTRQEAGHHAAAG